ncbi:tyrosinase family protein [Bradyrhizobium sp. CCGE-LA001]|uniref:tyrosinase family protein n=1 Tax=Bradyrhizobium sp. CCGE-LA001 TaxID=1223566 RepID=UPI0009F8BAF3|nr:tyrosinase family protein [Bradyrhizobium sp. CCGE-LA001]
MRRRRIPENTVPVGNIGRTSTAIRAQTLAGTVEQVRLAREARFPANALLYAGFYAGLKHFLPPDELAEEVWATCPHSRQGAPASHFLSWHRMYLFFFERVLREASGDSSFALVNSITNVDSTLNLDDFFPFQFTLETTIHGHIHCTDSVARRRRVERVGASRNLLGPVSTKRFPTAVVFLRPSRLP